MIRDELCPGHGVSCSIPHSIKVAFYPQVAFSISFASLWFLSTTTATSYSLVGSLNKIPVAIIGLVAFNVPWNMENLASILVGLVAGIVFVKAKSAPVAK